MPDEAPATIAGLRSGSGVETWHQTDLHWIMGRWANPRTLLEWTRTALASSTSYPRIRLNSSASATRASIRARCAPRQKWAPLPKLMSFEPISRPMTIVVGVLEHPLVAVRRTGQQQQDVAVGNRGVVEVQLAGDDAGQELAGRVVAQRLLDPQRDPLEIGVDRGQLIGVLVAPERRIGKQFGGGLVAGDHHQEHEAEHFFVGQPVAVDLGLEQRGRQIVGRLLAAVGDHLLVVDDQVDRRLDRGLGHVVDAVLAVHDAVGHRPDAVAILDGHAHQLGDDVHRQLAREFRDVVDGFAGVGLLQHRVEMLRRRVRSPVAPARGCGAG